MVNAATVTTEFLVRRSFARRCAANECGNVGGFRIVTVHGVPIIHDVGQILSLPGGGDCCGLSRGVLDVVPCGSVTGSVFRWTKLRSDGGWKLTCNVAA